MRYWWPVKPGSHELSRQVTELLLRPENVTTAGDTETGTAGGNTTSGGGNVGGLGELCSFMRLSVGLSNRRGG